MRSDRQNVIRNREKCPAKRRKSEKKNISKNETDDK